MNQIYKVLTGITVVRKYLVLLLLVALTSISYSQTPGMIIKSANSPGNLVLDPDGDGYVSQKTNGVQLGFTIPPDNDVLQSEIPYVPIVRPDPTGDILRGPTGGFCEIVGTDAAGNNAVMIYNDGTNLLFRFRLGGYAPNSKSYSVLIDSDQKFGTSGTSSDPNAVTGNLGFEVEIVLKTNFSVDVYNIDGVNTESDVIGTSPGYRVATHPFETNCQQSVAVSQAGLDPDYFYDFYIPFSDLSALGITTSTPLRFVTLTTMNPAGAIGNNALSDIGGVTSGSNIDAIFEDLIDNQTPTSISDIDDGGVLDRSSCPSINGPIYSNSNSISGTSSEANGTTIKVYQDGILIGTTTVSGGIWTLSSVTGLIAGKTITATATATDKGTSSADCDPRTVIAAGTSCTVPDPTNLVLSTGNKVLTFSYSGSGNVVTLYDASNNTAWSGVNNPLTTTSATSYTMGQSSGSTTVPTNFYLIATNGSCKSAKVFYCASTFSTTPTITTPVTAGSTSISGTCGNAQTATVTIFKNNVSQGTATVSGTTWTKSGLTLAINDELYVTSKEGTLCMTSSSVVTVSCSPSTTPTINQNVYTGDNVLTGTCGSGATVAVYKDGSFFGNATVSGTTWSIAVSSLTTSTTFYVEATETSKCASTSSTITVRAIPTCGISGTYCGSVNTIDGYISASSGTLQLYKENGATDIAIGSPYTLTSSGSWEVTSLSLVGGDQVYAVATLTRGSTSTSETITIGSKNTHIPSITTDPIYEGDDQIDGTGYDGNSINLYIGGAITDYTTTVSSSNWTLSSIPSYELYLGASVYATASAVGECESDASATKIVQCVFPTMPSYTGGDKDYCVSGQGEVDLNTSETGVIYQLVDGSGASHGPSVAGTGSAISLYTNQLTADLTGIYVKAYKIMNSSCMITSTTVINFNNQLSSPSVTFNSLSVSAAEGSATVNLDYSSKSSLPSADQYTIDYNTAANNNLFVDITSKTTIPASAIGLSIPTGLSTGTYYGTITIYDAAGEYCSRSYGFSITIYGNSSSAPVISSQPTNATVCSGNSTTLSVTAAGTITGYQWEQSTTYNGTYTNVSGGSGGTTASYTTANLTSTTYYRVKVINGTLYTYSDVATVTVPALPSAAGPISGLLSVCEGQTAVSYSVDPISNATSYTWTYSGTNVTNIGTTNSININFGDGATSGTLTVVGTNSCGSGISSSIAITVNPKPTVSAGSSVCVGSTITLSPTTGGTWISSDDSKATVTNSGEVTGVAAGSATFTFTNSTTGCSATTPSVIISSLNPTFSINDVSISEGNSGTSNLIFTVSLASAVCGNVSVDYATSDGTATTANNDYSSTSGTLTIIAGNTSGTISVPIIGDRKVELDETFTVTLSNPSSGTISDAIGTGTITNDDNSPSIADATISIDENTPNLTVIKDVNNLITGNDLDIDGDQNNYSILSGNESGAFAINLTTGEITVADYTKLDYETTPSFILTVQATDGYNTSSATITINLNNVNDLSPIIDDVTVSLAENSPNATPVTDMNDKYTGTDFDREGQAITYSITGGNSSGAFTINSSTGEITVADYTKLDFEVTPTFTLTVQASDGTLTDNATVTINLTNVNEAPTVSDFTKNGTEDNNLTFTATDFTDHYSDVESTALSAVKITSLPLNGTLKLSGVDITLNQVIPAANLANITFTPTANWNGTTSFTWNASDGSLYASADKTVTIDIAAVNDAPTASSSTVSTTKNTDKVLATTDFGYSDVEGDAINLVQITLLPSLGTLYLDLNGNGVVDAGEAIALNGTISKANLDANYLKFKPAPNEIGSPYTSFDFKVNDGTTYSVSSYTITINVTNTNSAPVASNVSVTTAEDNDYTFSSVDFNYSDPDSDPLSLIQVVSLPANGTLYNDANLNGIVDAGEAIASSGTVSKVNIDAGKFKFKPVANANGTPYTSFDFKVNDGTVYSASSYTMTINVTPVNDAPVAAADSYTVAEGGTLNISAPGLLSNDTDAEGSTLTAVKVTDPAHGTLTLNSNGSFTYVHDGSETTSDSFTYKANDGSIDGNTVTVSITVTPVNDPPDAMGESYTVAEGGTLSVSAPGLLSNDTDAEGNTLSSVKVTDPSHGTLTFNTDGSFTYVHDGSETVSDSYT